MNPNDRPTPNEKPQNQPPKPDYGGGQFSPEVQPREPKPDAPRIRGQLEQPPVMDGDREPLTDQPAVEGP